MHFRDLAVLAGSLAVMDSLDWLLRRRRL